MCTHEDVGHQRVNFQQGALLGEDYHDKAFLLQEMLILIGHGPDLQSEVKYLQN